MSDWYRSRVRHYLTIAGGGKRRFWPSAARYGSGSLLLSALLLLLLSACASAPPPPAGAVAPAALSSTPTSPPAPTPLPPTPLPSASPTPPGAGRTVVIDPGHGGEEDAFEHELPDGSFWWEGVNTGAGRKLSNGDMLWEKDVNWGLAQALADRLTRSGYRVVFTRTEHSDANTPPRDVNGDGQIGLADDLQARVDVANAVGGDLFVSIHFNAHSEQKRSGTTTIYCVARPFGKENRRLAGLMHENVLAGLRRAGYDSPDQGIYDDEEMDEPGHFLVLGPASPKNPRPNQMPGVLVEPLFLTDPVEYKLAARQDVLDSLADGMAQAITDFLAGRTAD